MSENLLKRLSQADSDDDRQLIIIQQLLASLPKDLSRMAWAAAVPHWFDANILAILYPELAERSEELYVALQGLPFVESFAGRGHNIHGLTRRLMLAHLWRERREEYVMLSWRAAEYYAALACQSNELISARQAELAIEEPDEGSRTERLALWMEEHRDLLRGLEPQSQIECIYHLLVADPEEGANALRDRGAAWHNPPLYNPPLVSALAESAREHAEAGRVDGRGRGWGYLWEGLTAFDRYQPIEAIKAFQKVMIDNYEDGGLNAEARRMLGDVHMRLSELPEARARYEEALQLSRAIGNKLGEANCTKALGDVYMQLSELPEARARYEEALQLSRAIGNKLGESNGIRALGDVHMQLSELPEARARYEEALTLYRAIGAGLGEANCIRALGDVHVQLSELHEARARYEEILPLYLANGEILGEANCLKALGDVHKDLSELPEARARYEGALPLYRAIGEKLGEANCIRSLGHVYMQLSELPEARARYEEALQLSRAIGNKLGESNGIRALGDVHMQLSELPEARARYEEALQLSRAIGNKLGEANCTKALGDVYMQLSELPEARARYEEALPLYRAIGEKLGEANCIKALGELAAKGKDYTTAFDLLEESISRYRSLLLSTEEAGVINVIANIYDDQKEQQKAIETYTRALALPTGLKGYILRNRANQYLKLRDTKNAARDIEAAAELQPNSAYLFLRRGELAIVLGQYDEAFVHFNAALERYPRMIYAYFGIGRTHLCAGQPEQAMEAYRHGLAVTNSPSDLEEALDELEKLQQETGKPAHVEAVRQLIHEWKDLRDKPNR